MIDSVWSIQVLAPVVVALFLLLNYSMTSYPVPDSLNWFGRRKELFSKTRACLREYTRGFASHREGYAEYSKKGLAFILPDPSLRPQVMLPPDQVRWLIDQPASDVSHRMLQMEKFAIKYLNPKLDREVDLVLHHILRRDLTRSLGRKQSELFDELRLSVEETLGTDDESWTQICLYHVLKGIILRSTYRVAVGLPLCRDPKWLSASESFSKWTGFSTILVGQMIPKLLRPILGCICRIPVSFYSARCMKILLPVVKTRMEVVRRKIADPSDPSPLPDDMFTWFVTSALDHSFPSLQTADSICEHFLYFILLALQTTGVAGAYTFLDLLSSPPELGYFDALRNEAASTFTSQKDWEDVTRLGRLKLIDSTIRESLRLHPVNAQGPMREVIRKDGIFVPDGPFLRQGTWVGFSIRGIHTDDRFYPNPDAYEPFRFCKTDAGLPATQINQEDETPNQNASEKQKKLGIASIDETFLSFGLGKNACPGRFFAAHLLKLLIAYITLHYEIQPLDHCPAEKRFGDSTIPSTTTSIQVRRRKFLKTEVQAVVS